MLKRNLVTSVLLYESVRTTKKRAKAVQPLVDKIIHLAKTKPAHLAIRMINQTVTDKNACKKVMEVLKDRYANRSSGLTRMVPAGARKGDGAELVDLSLVEGIDRPDDWNPESGIRKDTGVRVPDTKSRSKKKSIATKKP